MWRPGLLDQEGQSQQARLVVLASVNALSIRKAPLEHALVHRVEARVVHAAECDRDQAQDAQAAADELDDGIWAD